MNILVLDDDPLITKGLSKALKREGYSVFTAERPSEAIAIAGEELIDLLVCDVRMPESDGLEALGSLRTLQGGMRCIIITGYASEDAPIRAVKSGVDDYLLKPFNTETFLKSVRQSLALRRVEKRSRTDRDALKRRYLQLVSTIVNLFLSRETFYRDHVRKVASLATDLGAEMGLTGEALDRLELAALLHDVGLATVDRDILLKAEPLDEAERILLTRHPQAAARSLLSGLSELTSVVTTIEHLRENYDGSGHPGKLKGEAIPIESRILRVAEAYDSLTSQRPQREALSISEALAELEKESGEKFDPGVVALCDALARESRDLADPTTLFRHGQNEIGKKERVSSLVSIADLLREAGQNKEAAKAYELAQEVLGQEEEQELQVTLHIGKAQTALADGSKTQGSRWAAKARHALEGQEEPKARHVLDLSRLYLHLDRKDLARKILELCPVDDPLSEERTRLNLRLAYTCNDLQTFLAEFEKWWKGGQAVRGLSPIDAREACGILLAALRSSDLIERGKSGLVVLVKRYPHLLPLVKSRLPKGVEDGFLPERVQTQQVEDTSKPVQVALEVRLLGALQVRCGGNAVPPKGWTTRKARELFSLLAYHGRPVSAGRLEELLWPHGGDKVRTNLHTTVSRVRRALRQAAGEEQSVLQSDGDFYLLDPEVASWCDVSEFEKLAETALQGEQTGPLSTSREQAAQKCLSLYQGDFLEGIWEEWTFQPRTNLKETWFKVQQRLAEHYLANQKGKAADGLFQEMLTRDSCREEAHLGLMRSALEQNRRDQAVVVYHRYCELLRKEMNLDPSPTVQRFYLEVIDQGS